MKRALSVLGPDNCGSSAKPLGSLTYYNTEAILFLSPEGDWTVEEALRPMVGRQLGISRQPDLREKLQAQIHLVAGDSTS